MSEVQPDLVLIEAAIDAAQVLHDHLTGVVNLSNGEIGGVTDAGQGWRKRLRFDKLGQRSLAKGFAGLYGPEQLNRAGPLAVELTTAVTALELASSPIAVQAGREAKALGLDGFASTLTGPTASPGAPEIADLYRQLGRAMTVLGSARSKVLLARMREH